MERDDPGYLRAVAIDAGEWVNTEPPPVGASAWCDIPVIQDLLLFTGDQLRLYAAEERHTFPQLASFIGITPPKTSAGAPGGDDGPFSDHRSSPMMAAHGASELRMRLPRAYDGNRWICTRRMARQVWPEAPDHDLRPLVAWRHLHPAVSDTPGEQPVGSTVAEDALLTALLLVDLLERRSVWGMCVASTSFLLPTAPVPALDDAIGWARVSDDDLTWLGRLGGNDAWRTRMRAAEEIERRFRSGRALPHLDQPPVYSVESCDDVE